MVKGFLPDDAENPEHFRNDLATIPPSHDPTDNPVRCYKINTDYIRFLVSGIDYFVHSDAFSGGLAERELAAQRMVALQVLLMTGNVPCGEVETLRLRQNPLNPCQLEQSFDNGATWSLAFDYSLCLSSVSVYSPQETANNIATATATATAIADGWGGTWQELAPGMDYDLSDVDELRDQAYCFAVSLFISQIAAALGKLEDDGWSVWDVTKIVARVVEVGADLLLGVISATGTPISPVVYVGTQIVKLVVPVVREIVDTLEPVPDLGDFLAPETQDLLVCCAMDVIGGMTPSASRFDQMFDVCADVNLSSTVVAALQSVVSSNDAYMAFLLLIQQAFEALSGGQRYNCPCDLEERVFEFTTEFGVDPDTFYGLSGWYNPPFNHGCFAYIAESGIIQGDEDTGDYTNHRGISIGLDGVTGEVHSVEVEGNLINGLGDSADIVAEIVYGTDREDWYKGSIGDGDPISYRRDAIRNLESDTIYVGLYSDTREGSAPAYTGSCKIRRIIVRGKNLIFS